jgi:hypothetical protein
VSANHQLPGEPVRSKGQATLVAPRFPELPATVRDISASGIGVVTADTVKPGTLVDIHVHDYATHGIVHSYQPQDGGFYIAIALAA